MKTFTYLGAALAAAAFAIPSETGSAEESGFPLSGITRLVHKQGAEGSIMVDAFSGQVLTPADERPEWADGLAMANFAERHKFYTDRLGTQLYTPQHQHPELYAFEDLEWLAIAMEDTQAPDGTPIEAGGEMMLAADDEFRMEAIAVLIGADRETGEIDGKVTEVMLADDKRSDEQMADFRQAQEAGFEQATGTANK